jgi:diketogulonate reductase-like aldo/keto reductase
LIHWPGVKGIKNDDVKVKEIRRETWRGLENCVQNGLVKSIGVSNYTKMHLNELLDYAVIQPSVIQSEYHPYLQQNDILSVCRERGIFFQAYSSLGTSDKNLSNEVFKIFFTLVPKP